VGKAMMDLSDGTPPGLRETTADSLRASDDQCRRWHGAASGRIRYAYAPRFLLSCTDRLLRAVAERIQAASGADGPRLHTHAAEQPEEVALVRARTGLPNIEALAGLGLLSERAVLAHCVHVAAAERRLLAGHGAHVAHCPSSNLKLGSGVAPVVELLEAGVNVALGADGAPCNNNLDGLHELRLCALLQKGRLGPAVLPARQALELATLGGARALGLAHEIGSLVPGKRADVIVVDARALHATPSADPASLLVYALRGSDVRDVLVDGRLLVRGRRLTERTGLADQEQVLHEAEEQARLTLRRAGLA
jgi:cytosine/adenosine deaminase-related metal-dependent hydrolase